MSDESNRIEWPSAFETMQHWLAGKRDRLPMFVIYDHPTDFPDSYVARLWVTLPQPQSTEFVILSERIGNLRQIMEQIGFAQLARDPADDPKALETWI
jgi:hypothetical protein